MYSTTFLYHSPRVYCFCQGWKYHSETILRSVVDIAQFINNFLQGHPSNKPKNICDVYVLWNFYSLLIFNNETSSALINLRIVIFECVRTLLEWIRVIVKYHFKKYVLWGWKDFLSNLWYYFVHAKISISIKKRRLYKFGHSQNTHLIKHIDCMIN